MKKSVIVLACAAVCAAAAAIYLEKNSPEPGLHSYGRTGDVALPPAQDQAAPTASVLSATTAAFSLTAPNDVIDSGLCSKTAAVGDVTGDGRDDVVVASYVQLKMCRGEVRIFEQGLNGTLSLTQTLFYADYAYGVSGATLTLADLNGDGTQDIAVGHMEGIVTFVSDRHGHFNTRVASTEMSELAGTMDVDQDGLADIIGIHPSDAVIVRYSDGTGGIRSTGGLGIQLGDDFRDLEIADVTGDDLSDVVVSHNTGVTVYRQKAAGEFDAGVDYPYSGSWYAGLKIADLNRDGRNDVVVAEEKYSPSQLWIYLQNSSGKLAAPTPLPTNDASSMLLTHDLDRDGREDLMATHYGSQSAGKTIGYYTQATGTFVEETLLDGGGVIASLEPGDLNSDGCGDVVALVSNSIKIMWGQNCVLQRPAATPNDINADFVSDLIWRNDLKTHWAYWTMMGPSVAGSASYAVGADWTILATADFDGNGYEDLIWSNGSIMQMWRGSATGYTGVAMGMFPTGYRVVASGDLDGDGKADLVWRDNANSVLATWFMDGATIIDGRVRKLDARWRVAATGDLTNDRRTDLVVATDSRMELWVANPNRTFSPTAMGTYPPGWQLADTADVDGDGFADLLWRYAELNTFVYWNMRGTHRIAGAEFPVPTAWSIVQTGDFTADGHADIVWTNGTSMQLWASEGRGFTGLLMPNYPSGWSLVR